MGFKVQQRSAREGFARQLCPAKGCRGGTLHRPLVPRPEALAVEMGVRKSFESFLHYKAPKYVEVRSLNLGVLSKIPYLCIFLYIVVWQILLENRHMMSSGPAGMARLQLQRPTARHCNPNHRDCLADFTPISGLEYCLPNHEDVSSKVSARQGEKAGGRLPCWYMDEKQMNRVGFQHFTLMVPTRITRQKQKSTGNCGPDSKKACKNVFEFTDDEEESVYVADVERFTLLIETAFTLPPEDLSKTPVRRGASNDFPGFWEVCEDTSLHEDCRLEKIPCLMAGCDGESSLADRRLVNRRLRGAGEANSSALQEREDTVQARRLSADKESDREWSFFGLPFGDVISMGELLQIAGVDLDRDTDTHGESRRSTGIALQIDISFDNHGRYHWNNPLRSAFGKFPVKYTYRVSKLPFQTYKEVSEEDEDGSRVLIDKHGIFVNVNIEGSIRYFDITQTLLILTTGLSLLAGAHAFVNCFASYVWKFKDEFKMEKNDRSRNYDKDDPFCFCCTAAGGAHPSEVKTWAHFSEHPEEFTRGIRALDGDTLALAGDLLMALHRLRGGELGDPEFVEKERQKWEVQRRRFDSEMPGASSSQDAAGMVGAEFLDPSYIYAALETS
uniref:Uncharacterized protein n=1 Tax=Alexandrium monilatum TaxID=311494 RepID=A0A7S4S0U2_9DINO